MTIKEQKQLRAIYELVRDATNIFSSQRFSPVDFQYEPNHDVDESRPEIIMDKYVTLNPHMAHFRLCEMPSTHASGSLSEAAEFVISKTTALGWNSSGGDNPKFNCLNFKDGVDKLFTALQEHWIVIWQPSVMQRGTGRILHRDRQVYVWDNGERGFVCLATKVHRGG